MQFLFIAPSHGETDPQETKAFLIKTLKQLSNTDQIGAFNENSEVTVKVSLQVTDEVKNAEHSKIDSRITDTGVEYILMVDNWALRNPIVLIKNLLQLEAATNNNRVITEYAMGTIAIAGEYEVAELRANAESGSLVSQLWLARLDKFLLSKTILFGKFLDRFHELLGNGDIKKTIKTVNEYRKAETAKANAEVIRLKKLLNPVFQKKYKSWKVRILTAPINDPLKTAILSNDRRQVTILLNSYLPWELMEPSERNAWKIWLEAIEKPNPQDSVLTFRGLGPENFEVMPFAERSQGDRSYALASMVLTNGDGNYLQNILEYWNQRLINRDPQTRKNKLYNLSPTVSPDLNAHSSNSEHSPYISFTAESHTALNFMSGGYAIIRVDKRRLIPNLQGAPGEHEVLAPLFIFPDEILIISERGRVSHPYAESTKKVERENGDRTIEKLGFTKQGVNFFNLIYPHGTTVLKCMNLF